MDQTIVDIVLDTNAKTGEFSYLIAALKAADPMVLAKLGGPGQFTVFAPTDAAFVCLLDELNMTADELLSNQALVTRVLLYHVAKGNRDSAKVLASSQIRTLQRGFIYQESGVLTDANGRTANIIALDIMASNGVIHVIDHVIGRSQKCDLCADTPHLGAKGGPGGVQACVQSCALGAIAFTRDMPKVNTEESYHTDLRGPVWKKLGMTTQ